MIQAPSDKPKIYKVSMYVLPFLCGCRGINEIDNKDSFNKEKIDVAWFLTSIENVNDRFLEENEK